MRKHDDDVGGTDTVDLRRRIIIHMSRLSCPLCDADGGSGTDDGPWHLAFECTHADAVRQRRQLISSVPHMLKQLLSLIQAARARSSRLIARCPRSTARHSARSCRRS
jgi:hypothetical protein